MKRGELPLAAAAVAAATFLLTLPLGTQMQRVLPSDLTDTLLATWILAWDAERLRHGLQGVWDAPIFYPYHGALAFSENLLGIAIFVAPIEWVTRDPVLAYNSAFLLEFVVAGVGMYLLARELTGSRLAAAVAGAYYSFCPFRMAQIAHLQMVATGWMPIALWGLHRYFSTRRPRWLAVFAAGWILQTLSSNYVGYFMVLPVLAVSLDRILRIPAGRARVMGHVAAACVAVAAALVPVGAAYYRVRADYHLVRGVDEITANGADLRSYVVGKSNIGIWRRLPTAVVSDPEKELFPGVIAFVFAAIAVAGARKEPRLRPWIRLYSVVGAVAVVFSFGPRVRVWGAMVTRHGPYDWLLRIMPGMDGMRVPARFAIVAFLALSVLAACGMSLLVQRLSPRWRGVALAASLAAIAAEGWEVPLPVLPFSAQGRPEDRSAAMWLRASAPGAVLHLPVKPPALQDVHYQYATLQHGHPIVNGYSGYATPLLQFLSAPFSPLSDFERFPAAVRFLRSIGVRYVLVHPDDYATDERQRGTVERTLASLRTSGQTLREASLVAVKAFELAPWTEAHSTDEGATLLDAREFSASASESSDRVASMFDGDADSRWIAGLDGQTGSSWVSVVLPAAVDVERVELQIAERSMMDYPRALRIDAQDAGGLLRTLYEDSPYPELAAALLENPRYPTLRLRLPPNQTVRLWIRQTAATRRAWSIHELRVFTRHRPGGRL
jgi:hypothetical protein